MSDAPITMSSGLPSTVLPPVDPHVSSALASALAAADPRAAVAQVVADHPRCLDAWATLGDLGRDPVERYAAYRVGYHRGLDALRANGWRGSGYVRWSAPSNHGFLRSLLGLQRMAAAIGERDEAERCELFLAQLDPAGVPAGV
ncbi:MAG: DUF3151 domain-containing protein [Ilumatobacteraceae bacterium]|nr:DUF3151 domain-containing protein [Ilumatobacteraceae bacterium]